MKYILAIAFIILASSHAKTQSVSDAYYTILLDVDVLISSYELSSKNTIHHYRFAVEKDTLVVIDSLKEKGYDGKWDLSVNRTRFNAHDIGGVSFAKKPSAYWMKVDLKPGKTYSRSYNDVYAPSTEGVILILTKEFADEEREKNVRQSFRNILKAAGEEPGF